MCEPLCFSTAKIVMERDDPSRSRGFGFVTVNSADDIQKAVEKLNDTVRFDFSNAQIISCIQLFFSLGNLILSQGLSQLSVSLYNITPGSNSRFLRIKEMITN